jgi:hypothetical protein
MNLPKDQRRSGNGDPLNRFHTRQPMVMRYELKISTFANEAIES